MKMRRMRMLTVMLSMLAVVLIGGCSKSKKNNDVTHDDYTITVESNDYYPGTYTGKIVLSIENTKSGLDKLLYSSDDLKQDGHKYIVGDKRALNVQQREEFLICRTYEERFESHTQIIVVEYIDFASQHSGEPLTVQLVDSERNVTTEIHCPMTTKDEAVEFCESQGDRKIIISPKGFLVENVSEEVTSFIVTYEDDSEEVFIDVESAQVYKPTVAMEENVFYQEIPKWDEIKVVECNGMSFER